MKRPQSPVASDPSSLREWIPRLIEHWRVSLNGGNALVPGPGSRPDRTSHGSVPASRRIGSPPADRLTEAETRIAGGAVRDISRGLTGARALAGAGYLDDPRLLGAYLLFYWSVSYAQTRYVIDDLVRRGIGLPGKSGVLDIGSGPGPVASALSDAGFGPVVACDGSPSALAALSALAEGHFHAETRLWRAEGGQLPDTGDKRFGCVAFGHVLNEIGEKNGGASGLDLKSSLVEEAAKRLGPGGFVLILEPALLSTSRELLALRDILVSRGYPILGPCLFRGPCPALLQDAGTCHAEVRWELPPHVRDLARAARIDKEELKMSYLAIGAKGASWPGRDDPGARPFRVVSDPMLNKAGKTRFMICGIEGRFGLMGKAGSGFPAEKAFFSLKRGDVFGLSGGTEKRETGESLSADTRIAPLSGQ